MSAGSPETAATGGDQAVRALRRVGPRGLDAAGQDVEDPQARFKVRPAHAEKGASKMEQAATTFRPGAADARRGCRMSSTSVHVDWRGGLGRGTSGDLRRERRVEKGMKHSLLCRATA